MLGVFLACFAFSFSKSQRFLQCLLWPDLSAARAKPLQEAEVGLSLTWKCQGGVFRSLPLVFRKTWTGAGPGPVSRDAGTFLQPLQEVSGRAQGSSAPGRPACGTYKQGQVCLSALAFPSITREKGQRDISNKH